MSKQVNPLPTEHVFVLQLQESQGRLGTCPPNAFRSGEALISLEPGEIHNTGVRWRVD